MTRAVVTVVGVSLLASACTSGGSGTTGGGSTTAAPAPQTSSGTGTGSSTAPSTGTPSSSSSSTTPAPQPLSLVATAAGKNMNPTEAITVTAANGTLRSVVLRNPDGAKVVGTMSADRTSWHSTEVLGYSKTYKLTARAADPSGEELKVLARKYTTLTPDNMTMPYINTIYGNAIVNKGTYGVGMIPVVNFDESIADKKAAEKALVVTTSPHVDGSWMWTSDHEAHWRPRNYYQSGTKVTIAAKVYGVNVGNGIYGQADKTVSFVIGRKQITIADDTAPNAVNKVRTWRNGTLIRTMNTSMGTHGGTYANGQYISYYTMDGSYTVLGFENPARMCSASYGLPANAPGGYPCENIPWSTKISTDGIYLHELDSTQWAQDSGQDVSHGCLNLTEANASWFFTHSLVGDPVIIHGTKAAPKITLAQGGDWSVPWKTWAAGSALS